MLQKNPESRAVLIQHTLGFPADIENIKSWCDEHELVLIEDLAQSYGGKSLKGNELGSFGDVVILSFGRDKILDGITGGCCIIRKKFEHEAQTLPNISAKNRVLLLFYPMLTFLIRTFFQIGIGKALHVIGKITGIVTNPIQNTAAPLSSLDPCFATLVLLQQKNLHKQLEHRKMIANIYLEELQEFTPISAEQVKNASNLRFPLIAPNPATIISSLKKEHIFISDRWYRSAVDCGSLGCNSVYMKGSCPKAEHLAHTVLNLPTHQYIQIKDAKIIAQKVKQCLT